MVVAIGAMAGAALGNDVGHSLDWADRRHLSGATKARHQGPIGKRINHRDYDFSNFCSVTASCEGRHQYTGARCWGFYN